MKRAYLLLGVLSLVIAWRVISIPRESTPIAVEDTSVPQTTLFSSEKKEEIKKEIRKKPSAADVTVLESSPEFKALLNETLLSLPTEEQAKAKNVDPHHGDPGLGDASTGLGKIVDEMKANPALIPDGVAFYRSCALKESVLTAIRALCLRNLTDWNEKSPRKVTVSWDDYPSQIQFIAKQLPTSK